MFNDENVFRFIILIDELIKLILQKRFDFEQMKNNFNIDFIEAFEQMSFSRRRSHSSERERREKRENDRDVRRDARNNARNNARNDVVKDDVEDDVTDKTNVFMKNVS